MSAEKGIVQLNVRSCACTVHVCKYDPVHSLYNYMEMYTKSFLFMKRRTKGTGSYLYALKKSVGGVGQNGTLFGYF